MRLVDETTASVVRTAKSRSDRCRRSSGRHHLTTSDPSLSGACVSCRSCGPDRNKEKFE
jgi:hypothetical protein